MAFLGYTIFSIRNLFQPASPPGKEDSVSTFVKVLSVPRADAFWEAVVCALLQQQILQDNSRQRNFIGNKVGFTIVR